MRKAALFILAAAVVSCGGKEKPKQTPKEDQILAAVVRDVLCGDNNKAAREFYGTEGDHTVILLNGESRWPQGFTPMVKDFTFVFGRGDQIASEDSLNRRLAIRLDRFDLTTPVKHDPKLDLMGWNGPIKVTILNGGGTANGGVIGGQSTWYSFEKKGDSWTVSFNGSLD
jgi:hypothetical protein